MSEKSSKDNSNSSEGEEDIRNIALKLRNDIKRRVHNGIEKRRKDKINYWIHKLSEVLPFKEAKRESKTHVLENIFQYINQLKEKNESLMFGNVTTINTINVEEIRRLTKRCKDLEEKNINYYRLLETAGISPNGWPQDVQFERPTKYSKKITEQQLNEFLEKSSDKKLDQMSGNNKRLNDFDENSGQNCNKKSKTRNRKRKNNKRESNRNDCPPTPLLPNSMNTSISSNSNQSSNSGQIVLLNDQNMSTVSADETPRLIVNTSNNGLNALNTLQFRQTMGSQQLQFLSTTPSMDTMHANTNLMSGQLLFNLNPPPPQPQATAVLLPNGQILPIISQPQQTQQQLLYAPNQSFVFTTPTQTQPTLISGQTANIATNIKTNTLKLIQNTNETQKPKTVVNEKPKEKTTIIETIPVSPKPINKKIKRKHKKQILAPKGSKNYLLKKNNNSVNEKSINCKFDDKKSIVSKALDSISAKTSDNKSKSVDKTVVCSKEKNKSKSRLTCDKNNENNVNSVKTISSKSKPVMTESSATPETDPKTVSNCDILAKATQSIFSPPPNTSTKQVSNSNCKKEVFISNNNNTSNKCLDNRKHVSTNDSIIIDNKCKKRQDSEPESVVLKTNNIINSNENEVINEYTCANSADGGKTATNANSAIELINDTNKNDNYVQKIHNNCKVDRSIATGHKAETKKSTNNLNNSNVNNVSTGNDTTTTPSIAHKLSNVSTPEQTNSTQTPITSGTEQHFNEHNEHNITGNSENISNPTSNMNRMTFDFNSQQNQTNSNPNADNSNDNQTIELPSLLLSSLNDENDVSAESVHSVSNSSLPAFLSLSPEHLNEYLPKENITNSSETEHTTVHMSREPTLSGSSSVQFRLNSNDTNVEQHSNVRQQDSSGIPQQKEQNYSQYSKPNDISVATTSHTETRSSYSSNFPTISSLITNDYSDFSLNSNKSVFSTNNSNNYFENLNPNPLMNHKMNSQNNNFLQFPLQNDNSLMPLYPMHSYPIHNYLNNNTTGNNSNNNTNSNTNRNYFPTNETQTTIPNIPNNPTPKAPQNPVPNQSQSQSRSQTSVPTQQQSKPAQAPQPAPRSQSQNQSTGVMPMRTQRNSSTERQIQPQQRHPSQQQQPQHPRDSSSSNSGASNQLNKNTSAVNSVQYSTNNSFSSYSAEALIRQNEPSIQQIQSNDQNRYNNTNTNNSVVSRIPQQTHSANMSFNTETNAIRSSSRASISYSAESLIQSNPMNTTNQMSNKSSQREIDSESLNNSVNIDNNNRLPYYQHFNHNINSNTNVINTNSNTNPTNNLMQRTEQNNSNNLFNFDHSLNSRLMATTSTPISQNYSNSYPQITFNSHLPDIRTSTTTTSSESLFPITSNATTVNSNSNRNLSSNSQNSVTNSNNNTNNTTINNNNNIQISHTVSNLEVTQQQPQQPQHSPLIYSTTNAQNSNPQQSKRSANNSFNSSVNSFIHTNVDSYATPTNPSMYSTASASLVDTNMNTSANHYQKSVRNNEKFTNCLQPTYQNPNTGVSQHNNPNAGCFFSNTGPNATFFPTSSGTPFPAPPFALPSAASPFDTTTAFSGAHRPPMFMPDFNTTFVSNAGANNPLPPIAGTNLNINSALNNNSNTSNSNNKSRETQSTNTNRSNQSKHKMSANSSSSTKSNSKKQNNSKHNTTASDNTASNTALRHLNDNYFSMSDIMSSTTTTPQTNTRYSNFSANSQTHIPNRIPVPSPASVSSTHSNNNNKIPTSSADTSSSYTLFRPQNNAPNVSNAANFSVNSLHNSNRTPVSTSTPSNFGTSGAAHHSSHATNFHLSNIFPDINSNVTETLSLSPMKFPPPVTPVVPPPVAPPLAQSAMDVSSGSYQNHHSSGHHQNLYHHSHHSSARISTPHNAFNTFLSSGTPSTHNTNTHNFDPHITPNNRTASTTQMTAISPNTSHSTSTFAPTHHSHHTYANIVPSFNF